MAASYSLSTRTAGDSRCAQGESPQIWWQRWDPWVEDISTRINEKTHSNSLRRTSDQKEFEGIRPGRLLGFVLHANRQTVRLRSWRRIPYELRLRWNPIHSPRLRSWNYTSGGLRRRRETSSQHPNFGCGASSTLGYGCKRNNLGWTGFYLNSCCIRREPFCL